MTETIYLDLWLIPAFAVFILMCIGSLAWGQDPSIELLKGIDLKIDKIIGKIFK